MTRGRSGGARRPTGPLVGAILTGTLVGHTRKGVMIELGATEALLPRARYGAAADRLEDAMFGEAVTVEVVADHGHPSGIGLSRIPIERSLRQPRSIDGRLVRSGAGLELVPADGSSSFAVVVVDRHQTEELADTDGTWLVGAPHGGCRLVLDAR